MTSLPELFKALSDPVRYSLVESLAENGESCACELLDRCTVSQPTLSHHMKALCASGLVSSRRVGTWVHYSLDRASFQSLSSTLADFVGRISDFEASRANGASDAASAPCAARTACAAPAGGTE